MLLLLLYYVRFLKSLKAAYAAGTKKAQIVRNCRFYVPTYEYSGLILTIQSYVCNIITLPIYV